MSTIEPPLVGLYQVIFQTVSADHNWHLNVEKLSDLEYTLKLQDGINTPQRYAQQAPSGDLKQMSSEVESKAHNDKPFFSMAMRIGVIGESSGANDILRSLSTFSSLFQHGGRPMNYLTEKEYKRQLSVSQIRDMFTIGSTHRPGFLVNSWELTGPVHIPPLNINEHLQLPLKGLETLPVRNPALLTGTWIGNCDYAGISDRVCIPEEPRQRSTHLIGRSGMGKTTVQEHMILSDIERGDGVAVLDPHGDLVERIIRLIPEEHAGRTIYFNPGDPEWVPIWNPLEPIPGQDSAQTADDIVQAIRSFVSSGGWGDRLENILRHIIFALLHLPKSTFLDISDLLRNKSDESKILRREILKVVDNETARQFWRHDYDKYSKDDLGPPKNKLSKLLVSGTVSLMLSQPDNQINFRQIMDQGSIFLVNLSTVGPMIRGILGCFILSLLHLTALSRSNIPKEERKQFHIHCDEAHRFMTDSLEDLIAETRKYRVSLSLAHQFMKQFAQKKTDAFSSVGSTIMFNVDSRDAAYLIKDLRGLVKVDDLTSLGIGEAIVRIGTDIVRTKMRDILKPPENNLRDQIISESRKKYYKPVHEVRKLIRWRGDRWSSPFSSPILIHPEDNYGADDEFIYDEF
jgi:RecA/RadA recombinase